MTRTRQFHTDSVMCGLSALALKTNAPLVLRDEALIYKTEGGAYCFGSKEKVHTETSRTVPDVTEYSHIVCRRPGLR